MHHVDGDRSNNDFNNFILLCTKCHRQVEEKRYTEPSIKIKLDPFEFDIDAILEGVGNRYHIIIPVNYAELLKMTFGSLRRPFTVTITPIKLQDKQLQL